MADGGVAIGLYEGDCSTEDNTYVSKRAGLIWLCVSAFQLLLMGHVSSYPIVTGHYRTVAADTRQHSA